MVLKTKIKMQSKWLLETVLALGSLFSKLKWFSFVVGSSPVKRKFVTRQHCLYYLINICACLYVHTYVLTYTIFQALENEIRLVRSAKSHTMSCDWQRQLKHKFVILTTRFLSLAFCKSCVLHFSSEYICARCFWIYSIQLHFLCFRSWAPVGLCKNWVAMDHHCALNILLIHIFFLLSFCSTKLNSLSLKQRMEIFIPILIKTY